jgi:hypothetical protein
MEDSSANKLLAEQALELKCGLYSQKKKKKKKKQSSMVICLFVISVSRRNIPKGSGVM